MGKEKKWERESYIVMKWDLFQRWLNICKLMNVTHQINKMKDKIYISSQQMQEKLKKSTSIYDSKIFTN